MTHDNRTYLCHILDSIKNISEFTRGIKKDHFLDNKMIQDAVIRNLEIIGEAAKKISKNYKEKHQNIEWQKIAGMRDVLIHDYLGVDVLIVWNVTKNRLPELKRKIEQILSDS